MEEKYDFIVIDGITFNIGVFADIKEAADFLDKFSNRTEDGDLKRELIGVYFNFLILNLNLKLMIITKNMKDYGINYQNQRSFIRLKLQILKLKPILAMYQELYVVIQNKRRCRTPHCSV